MAGLGTGDIAFDGNGNPYLATRDDINPFSSGGDRLPRTMSLCAGTAEAGDVMRWETANRLVRVILASIVFTLFMTWSFYAAVMTGWSVTEAGLTRLSDNAPGLLWSALLGVIAVGWCRLLMGWRPLSPWLLLALPMPMVSALELLGAW